VQVTDDGRQTHRNGNGHGLIGIRERVNVYGGQFSAGPGADGGFTVDAILPYQESAAN